eukprot:7488767-Alexandrium_andersonii.AAC.1
MAAGRHLEVLSDAMRDMSSDILRGDGADRFPLSPEEAARLQKDVDSVRAAMITELTVKLDYWQRLPWVMCGLAHPSEDKARTVAEAVLREFSKDPREHAHDS